MRRVLALSAALGAAAWISCIIPSFEVSPQGSVGGAGGMGVGGSTTATGGTGAAGGVGTGGVDICEPARWPGVPANSSMGTDNNFVVAMRTIDLGEGTVGTTIETGPTVGYDLDQTCTCGDEQGSCLAPLNTNQSSCDGPGGIDNASARMFNLLATFSASNSSAAQTVALEEGSWTLLVRVEGYNGAIDDDEVRVSLYPSPGYDDSTCNGPLPSWDGNDEWPVIDTSVVPGQGGGGGGGGGNAGGQGGGCGGVPGLSADNPRYVDANAYVSNFVLVGSLPEAGIDIPSGNGVFSLSLKGAFVTGRIVAATQGGYELRDGILTGRWSSSDMLESLGNVEIGGNQLCTDSSIYGQLKSVLCDLRDITSQLAGPTAPCDALSFAMGFNAEPAKLGVVLPTTNPLPPCPNGTDPGDDSCGM